MRALSLVLLASLSIHVAGCGFFDEGSSSTSHEVEPNDDVLHATEIASGEEIAVEGSCRDANDKDYFKVTAQPGTFRSTLMWADGAFEIGFAAESGVTNTAPITSAISPIEVETAVAGATQTQVIFVVDCNPAGTALPQGLDYRVDATIPQ